MVRPEGGQVSGNKGILIACTLQIDFFGESQGSGSLLYPACASGPCGLELDGTGGPLANRLQVEDQPLDSLMAYDIKCFLRHLVVLISQEILY